MNQKELNKIELARLIRKIHNDKPSYGYRRIRAVILRDIGWVVSSNLVHKVCKKLKIYSKAKHHGKANNEKGKESLKFANLVRNQWNVTSPFQLITTDTTMIKFNGIKYDWTYYVDAFDNSIVGSDVDEYNYGAGYSNHKKALENMLNNKIKRGYINQETILHSDQGSIYSSLAFNDAHKDYNIIRSMSRAGTPTDNCLMESKNGWLKSEMKIDFNEKEFKTVQEYIDAVIFDHNHLRPSYALKYKTPIEYRTQLGFT